MHKKYWVNKNLESIKVAFSQFCKHNKKSLSHMKAYESSYFDIENDCFKYSYVTHELRSCSWSDEQDYVENNQYSQEELDKYLSFLISLIVPRIKAKNIKNILNYIHGKSIIKYGWDRYFSDYYTAYGCDKKQISMDSLFSEIEIYLKENDLFRDKIYQKKF